ncbi:MAG: glycosyltransferase family 4 protein [bacterium]
MPTIQKKRIAFICFSSAFGGLEISTLQLTNELSNMGAYCLAIVPEQSKLAKEGKAMNLRLELMKPRIKYGDLFAAIHLAKLLDVHLIDIVVAMQSKDINLLAAVKMIMPRLNVVFYQQMQSQIDKKDPIHTWMYSKLSLWISLTNKMKSEVLRYTRLPEEKIRVVPLGKDLHTFNPDLYNQVQARRKFGIPLDRHVVGMIGRLDPQKGQKEFLLAIPKIKKVHPLATFIILGEETNGESGYKHYLDRLCYELGILDDVLFLPFTDQVAEFLSALDIFILPSYSETFGLVLLEAMAMEKPIIATDAGGVPEIIRHGTDGILIPPCNDQALAEAVIHLLSDPTLSMELSHNAREDVTKRFNRERCINLLTDSLMRVS